jgi:hypothetical protein
MLSLQTGFQYSPEKTGGFDNTPEPLYVFVGKAIYL